MKYRHVFEILADLKKTGKVSHFGESVEKVEEAFKDRSGRRWPMTKWTGCGTSTTGISRIPCTPSGSRLCARPSLRLVTELRPQL